jgi:hypothetical protein
MFGTPHGPSWYTHLEICVWYCTTTNQSSNDCRWHLKVKRCLCILVCHLQSCDDWLVVVLVGQSLRYLTNTPSIGVLLEGQYTDFWFCVSYWAHQYTQQENVLALLHNTNTQYQSAKPIWYTPMQIYVLYWLQRWSNSSSSKAPSLLVPVALFTSLLSNFSSKIAHLSSDLTVLSHLHNRMSKTVSLFLCSVYWCHFFSVLFYYFFPSFIFSTLLSCCSHSQTVFAS